MHNDVLNFWFHEIVPQQWWVKDPAFDGSLAERFGLLHAQACRCELYPWRDTARGRLAEIIVLDQFSRNIHRDRPGAFAQDPLALALAQDAVARGADLELSSAERDFLYMPYMHSESELIHQRAVELFAANGSESSLQFELKHRDIITRFGRYPHRNAILGRPSTAAELEFLEEAGSSF